MALALLAHQLSILAQPNLEEHEARGRDKAEPDQHQREDLTGLTADHRRAHRAGNDQDGGGTKGKDARAAAHGVNARTHAVDRQRSRKLGQS